MFDMIFFLIFCAPQRAVNLEAVIPYNVAHYVFLFVFDTCVT